MSDSEGEHKNESKNEPMVDSDSELENKDGDDDATESEYEGGAIKKKILTKGTGWEKPTAGAEVSVHYVGTLLDGTKFDSSRDKDELFKFKLGQGSVIKGWDKGVATMKKGEKALFTIAPSHAYGERGHPPTIPENATLQFEIELFSWTSEEDVTPGGEVKKTILKEGKGWDKPGELSKCTVKYNCKVEGGSKCVIGEEPPSSQTDLDLTNVDLPEGLVQALLKMKKEERAKVTVSAEFGYGKQGGEGVPPNANLVYDIELLDFTDAPKTYSMKVEEKLEHGNKLKDVGNAFFKKENVKRAQHFYEESAKLFQYEKTLEGENKKKADQLTVQSKGNLAACTLKAGDFAETVKVATEVLQLDPDNVKVLFRRAQAHHQRKDHDEALSDLKRVIELEGKTTAVVAKLLKEVKAEVAKERNAQAKLFGGMFNKISLVSERELAEAKKAAEAKSKSSAMDESEDDDDMPAMGDDKPAEATESSASTSETPATDARKDAPESLKKEAPKSEVKEEAVNVHLPSDDAPAKETPAKEATEGKVKKGGAKSKQTPKSPGTKAAAGPKSPATTPVEPPKSPATEPVAAPKSPATEPVAAPKSPSATPAQAPKSPAKTAEKKSAGGGAKSPTGPKPTGGKKGGKK